jgi:hypothetical protein
MAQVETIGGGESFADGKRITRKVYVLTEGQSSLSLPSGFGVVSGLDVQEGEAGTKRVTVQWTAGAIGGGSGSSGETLELIGGSREVPIQSHPTFKEVTDVQRTEIERAIQENVKPDTSKVPAGSKAEKLYKQLLKKFEFYLVPAVSLRLTTYSSTLPSLRELCTINAPSQGPPVGGKQNWLLTAINAHSTPQPTGGIQYEITREWTLSDNNGWDPDTLVYSGT